VAAQAVPRLREALGDEGVDELITLVDERLREQAVPRDEYHQVIAHLQRIDDRFIEMDRHFEVRFEQMSRHFGNRFDKMEQRVESRIDRRFGEMDRRLDRMDQRLDEMHDRMLVQSWWLIGSIALPGTVISLLLAIGLFVK
jgi:hypothetical protein